MSKPVYYNDNDPFAAQWLCNLVSAGLLPAGDVDDRSVKEVRPDDLKGYEQCHFFAGIGGWPCALGLAGWPGTGQCGPVAVPVSRYRALDNTRAMPTNDTSETLLPFPWDLPAAASCRKVWAPSTLPTENAAPYPHAGR